jgi:Na+/H+ antiporter NhaC
MELTTAHTKLLTLIMSGAIVIILAVIAFLTTEPVEEGSRFFGTFWALVPPIVAIVMALITKNVYLSLFVGILLGAVFVGDGNLEATVMSIMDNSNEDGDSWGFIGGLDTGILFFLVVLGIIGCLLLVGGGSRAYGEWALSHIKSRRGAQIMTAFLGVLIFIDDYFNCLTVGQVMRSVTDKFKISRAKLAYLIDSMAAPICIIAPISSWAAAVTSYMPEGIDGFELFCESIFYNFYALMTITMVIVIAVIDFDFGPMKLNEDNAKDKGDIYTTADRPYEDSKQMEINPNGKVYDLLIPIFLFLVPACIVFLVWSGGFFDPDSDFYMDFIGAMGDASASTALAYGSMVALILTIIYMLMRRTVSFDKTMDCIPQGFRNMVPAITILVFAWCICAITRYGLGAPQFVDSLVSDGGTLMNLLPALFMVLACFISFSTGTSWGTFGILLPIVYAAFAETNPELMIVGISACLSGAVFGDHCSPISDTTIMSSAGAQCSHLNHVSTQVPYALLVATVSFVFFLIAGFWQSYIVTILGIITMIVVLLVLKKLQKNGSRFLNKVA